MQYRFSAISIALLMIFALAGCRPRPVEVPAVKSTALSLKLQFSRELIEMIRSSETIVVSEHSYKTDYDDPSSSLAGSPTVYRIVKLDADQRAMFVSAIENFDRLSQVNGVGDMGSGLDSAVAPCVLEPHHTISFLVGEKTFSSMAVSFGCGGIEWDGSRTKAPPAFVNTLYKLVLSIGMQPKRDWSELARGGQK